MRGGLKNLQFFPDFLIRGNDHRGSGNEDSVER